MQLNLTLNKFEAVLLLSVLKQSSKSMGKKHAKLTILQGQDNGYTKEMAMALLYQMYDLESRIELLLEETGN